MLFFWTLLLFPAVASASLASSVKIRVRIAEKVRDAVVRGFDMEVRDSNSPIATSSRSSEWFVRCEQGKVLVIPRSGKNQFQVKPNPDGMLVLRSPISFQTPGGFLSLGTTPYREVLRVYADGTRCDVVNEVDIEKYLDGLVNSEFSSKWNEEAIAAQVVAARSYAFFQILEAQKDPVSYFDVDATTRDQVYNGALKEDFHASRAVARTRGQVLTFDSGKKTTPIKAFYHSACGGITEVPDHVWGGASSQKMQSVKCSYCQDSPRYRWALSLSRAEMTEAISKGVKTSGPIDGWPGNWKSAISFGKILDIKFSGRDRENRVSTVTPVWIYDDQWVELPIPGPLFRHWMGATRFRSTAFQATPDSRSKAWHFSGYGNGHGVGMCQWGAKTMGEKGFSMQAILKHYYPNANLRALW